MKKNLMVFVVILLIIGFGIVMIKNSKLNGDVINGSGDVQKITLGIKNHNYYPNTIKVKVNQPVRIYLDESVVGCYRNFTIRDFGIFKYLQSPEDYIEFTPTKTGSFRFACSMGMGTGTLIVE